MGRKSKLTESEWQEIVQRHLIRKESIRSLAEEFGISFSACREYIANRAEKIRTAANLMVDAEKQMFSLPVTDQITVINLAQSLRNTSKLLAESAEIGAHNARGLNTRARNVLSKVAQTPNEEDVDDLKMVGALTGMANNAAKGGMDLLAATSKGAVPVEETPVGGEVDEVTERLDFFKSLLSDRSKAVRISNET